ncbi:uncharacterized protein LOC123558983 [Mercenaria mercenaria]|uniref:uncharacterized protein LOC123558983 n=1 Tax=Mercenaria mercenaria TaxID=6596 RepID=UPI00234E6FA6|nr:uncharacterized protein LOC123558983 [Mercenaria mercenaria]
MSVMDHFTESGKSSDEIVLNFDKGNKLYVSESLLRYASPVFETMFEQKFKESETREIEMNEEDYNDFFELLLNLHPGKQKPVDEQNVLALVSLAHKYQMDLLLNRCKEKMLDMLHRLEKEKNKESPSERCRAVGNCFEILIKADNTKLEDLSTAAIQVIASFGYTTIIGSPPPVFGQVGTPLRSFSQVASTGTGETNGATAYKEDKQRDVAATIDDPIKQCKELFENIPDDLKVRVLSQRLAFCDKQ